MRCTRTVIFTACKEDSREFCIMLFMAVVIPQDSITKYAHPGIARFQ